MKVALFDYGVGNLHSLQKALEASGVEVLVTSDPTRVTASDALVLPGVGAFGPAAEALKEGRVEILAALREGLPCLGICLGMQLLFDRSEEAEGEGLGVVPGHVERIVAPIVPHMGWNEVRPTADPLFDGVGNAPMYFANSYHCVPRADDASIAVTEYAGRDLVSAVRTLNCWGVQYHPEKSSTPGRRLLKNFVDEAARLGRGRSTR